MAAIRQLAVRGIGFFSFENPSLGGVQRDERTHALFTLSFMVSHYEQQSCYTTPIDHIFPENRRIHTDTTTTTGSKPHFRCVIWALGGWKGSAIIRSVY